MQACRKLTMIGLEERFQAERGEVGRGCYRARGSGVAKGRHSRIVALGRAEAGEIQITPLRQHYRCGRAEG